MNQDMQLVFMLIRILQYNANRQSKPATDAWNPTKAIVHCSSALGLIGVRFTARQAQGNGIITVRCRPLSYV